VGLFAPYERLENILLSNRTSSAIVKIADFGLARFASPLFKTLEQVVGRNGHRELRHGELKVKVETD